MLNTETKPISKTIIKARQAIDRTAIVYHSSAFFAFGGRVDSIFYDSNIIARLDTSTLTWTRAGELNLGRKGHGVIANGDVMIVTGGRGNLNTEVCSLQNDVVECSTQWPTLDNYYAYPEMYLVDDTFCKGI